jgi:hypothetical protein
MVVRLTNPADIILPPAASAPRCRHGGRFHHRPKRLKQFPPRSAANARIVVDMLTCPSLP